MEAGVLTGSEIDSVLKRYDIYLGTFASDSFRLPPEMKKQANSLLKTKSVLSIFTYMIRPLMKLLFIILVQTAPQKRALL